MIWLVFTERVYWIVLIAIFSIFAAIVWVYVFPINENLGANLFTSAVFTVLTIVFLSWLLKVREQQEWKKVEKEVIHNVKIEFAALLSVIFLLLEGGEEIMEPFWSSYKDIQGNQERLLRVLSDLKGREKLKLIDAKVCDLLQMKGVFGPLFRINNRLTDAHQRYSRYFSPNLSVAIINIQRDILAIENQCVGVSVGAKSPVSKTDLETLQRIPLQQLLARALTDVNLSSVLTPFIIKDIIQQIYELQTRGFKFSYPIAETAPK
jgi:hypothetical protein